MIKFVKKVDEENGITHYYKVTDKQILHLNSTCLLINSLNLDDYNDIVDVSLEGHKSIVSEKEFDTEIRRIIYELEIDQYFKK